MDENTRSRRDPGSVEPDSDSGRAGHSIDSVRSRRAERDGSTREEAPKSEESGGSTRTQREEAPKSEESGGSVRTQRDGSEAPTTTRTESSRNSSETGDRQTIPGNTSETGAGSPTPDSGGGTTTRAPQIPGMPAGGCTRTAGMFLMMGVAIAGGVTRLVRK